MCMCVVTLRNCASSSVPWYTGAPAGLLTSADSLASHNPHIERKTDTKYHQDQHLEATEKGQVEHPSLCLPAACLWLWLSQSMYPLLLTSGCGYR